MKSRILFHLIFFLLILLSANACKKNIINVLPAPVVNVEADSVRFAIIGDFGFAGQAEEDVANMVKSWAPDFIITTGDNNYGGPGLAALHENVGQYYCDYIYNPGVPEEFQCTGPSAAQKFNRFFPTPGNNDYFQGNTKVYEEYFHLPGVEKYYQFRWGPIHFFSLDSGPWGNEPCCESEQAIWFTEQIAHSSKAFKLVFMHFPPYSPGTRGNSPAMQWDFPQFGVDAVLSGHDHIYARIIVQNSPETLYLVNGMGGYPGFYECNENPLDSLLFDVFCYNESHGAILATATDSLLNFRFYSIDDPHTPLDEVEILAD